jgi:hypothetical protein
LRARDYSFICVVVKSILLLLLAGWLAVAVAVAAAAPGVYLFSGSLAPAERTACGVDRLSLQQVAALDDLVRRESAVVAGAPAAVPQFSRRLDPAECRAAGLDRLTPAQVARLDGLVSRWLAADEPVAFASGGGTLYPAGAKAAANQARSEIHGTITLEYGAGSGGYSERTGAIDLFYAPPGSRFSFGFGYADSLVKFADPDYYAPGYVKASR